MAALGELDALRKAGDPLADACVTAWTAQAEPPEIRPWMRYGQLPGPIPEALQTLWDDCHRLPPWADERLMRTGADFFARNATDILGLLGCYSLPYCYAAANGAQVLWLSQRLHRGARERLEETAFFLLDVMAKGAFAPGGQGFRALFQVRLVHALVRHFTLKHADWDTHGPLGIPVNQEDMAGTNLAFSLIVLRGLQKVGFSVQPHEWEGYLHLWAVIGRGLGVDERLLAMTRAEAWELDKTIAQRQFAPSEAGRELTKALLAAMREGLPAGMLSDRLEGYVRFLTGDQVADMLDLPQDNLGLLQLGVRLRGVLGGWFRPADPQGLISRAGTGSR